MEQPFAKRPPHEAPELVTATVEDDTSNVSAAELAAHLTTPFLPGAASAQAPRAPRLQADVASTSLPSIVPSHDDLKEPPAASGEQQNMTATSPGAAMPGPHAPLMPAPPHILSVHPLRSNTTLRETELPLPSTPASCQDSLPAAPLESAAQEARRPKRPSSLQRKVVHRFAHLAYLTETCIDKGSPSVRAMFFAAEVTTGIHRVYIAFGLVVSLSLYMVIGSSAPLVCNLICSIVPACSSMRAVEYSTKEEDTKWLTYWIVFASFSITDHFSCNIPPYFPFYWLIKMTFLAYCFFPVKHNGSWFIYYRFVRRFIFRHRESIDRSSLSPSEIARSLSADKTAEPRVEGSWQYLHEDF